MEAWELVRAGKYNGQGQRVNSKTSNLPSSSLRARRKGEEGGARRKRGEGGKELR